MEPKELSHDIAGKILDADFQNIVKKVAAGKPLTAAERARIESRAAGSVETLAYAKTLVELASVMGVTRRTLERRTSPSGRLHVGRLLLAALELRRMGRSQTMILDSALNFC
jgi:hypothetical protein